MNDPSRKKRPIGVTSFSLVLIITSIIQIHEIPRFEDYTFLHQGLSYKLICFRYVISYLLRLVGLTVGVGLLFMDEFVRKTALALSCINICTIYLRHPYEVFLLYTRPLYERAQITSMSLSEFTWMSVIIRCVIDGGFSLLLIIYLTRVPIKTAFQSEGPSQEPPVVT